MFNQEKIIGTICNHPEQFFVARDLVSFDDFTDIHAAECWKVMSDLAERNMPTAFVYVVQQVSDISAEWADVAKDRSFGEDVEPYCKALLDNNRELAFKSAIAQAANQDDPASYLESAIEEYRRVKANDSRTFKELINETVSYIEEVSEGGSGIKTGFKHIDRQTGGLQNQRVMVVAARTGVGKTALTMQMALHIAKNGDSVGICSLEMGAAELGMRSIAHSCKADISGLYKADDRALGMMSQGMRTDNISAWGVFTNTEQYRLNEIINQIRVWVKKDGINIAIVDHIGLVEVPEAKSANERLGMVTRAMKKLAKELDIPIILVSQLNRSNDKENREPKISDLRDSGSIEQDADIILLMHKVEAEMMVNGQLVLDYSHHKFIMGKNRQGPIGPIASKFTFNGQLQTFYEEQDYSY